MSPEWPGKTFAKEALARNGYIGPAPVPLAAYTNRVRAQTTGDLHIGDRTLGPGDFHHSDAGTAHDLNYSVEGCTLLAVLPLDHELVQFAIAGA